MATPYEDTFLYWLQQRPAGSLSTQEVAQSVKKLLSGRAALFNSFLNSSITLFGV